MYRPVTVYQPVTGQPTTCLQPTTTTTCQPQRHRWFSWLHPHTWFGGGSRCCGSPPATTVYCQPPCGAQPYYPVPQQPAVIQGVPAQVVPMQPPMNLTPLPAGPRVPSPPTRILPGTGGAADFQPRIQVGPTTVTPLPSTTTPLPATTVPSTTFPGTTLPSTTTPLPSTTVPSFDTRGNYPPSSDPYRASPPAPNTSASPGSNIYGSGYRSNSTLERSSHDSGPVIRAPELNSALPPSVEAVPDLDARRPVAPINRAPQLLTPRDKTAIRGDQRWAVVPAVWPKQPATPAPQRAVVQTKATQSAPPPASVRYDDSGWTSGRW
jgi:hypothetical protein